MSWEDWGWHRRPPKRPPPEHGIRVKKPGATWWGQRWIAALERMSSGYSRRLERGRSYARTGRTHDLEVRGGRVTARVTGSRVEPYEVRFSVKVLSEAVWKKAIQAMADKAQFAAELLAGRMPQDIDAAFEKSGASLFPGGRADLQTDCSCPDWANPCKHVAATHYVLGEAFDRDPFLLFELRGRAREQVLEGLRKLRAGGGEFAAGLRRRAAREASEEAAGIQWVTLGKIRGGDYDRLPEPLPVLGFTFDEPPLHGGVLRQLGAPAGWTLKDSPADLLAPAIRATAAKAREIALAEPEGDLDENLEGRAPPGLGAPSRTGRGRRGAKKASRKDRSAAGKRRRD